MRINSSSGILLIALLGGCSAAQRMPNIARIYEQSALDETRNPVIVIHGVLGAQLQQRSTGKIVWGAFTSDSIYPDTPEGARAIALPLVPSASAFDYDPDREDVYASGPLDRLELSILYQVLSVNIYADILRSLGVGGYRDQLLRDRLSPRYAEDHYTCFTFFYDWRRDNVENAILLGRFIEEKRREIGITARAKIDRLRASGLEVDLGHAEEIEQWLEAGYNFDIVAHSMGALIARYYLRYGMQDLPEGGSLPELNWAGAEQIDRLVTVASPNFGSMGSMVNLHDGFKPGFLLPHFSSAILGSMPALYQILPRSRHGLIVDESGESVAMDFLDPKLWEDRDWGLLSEAAARDLKWLLPNASSPEQRREFAVSYLRWCLNRARQFHAAIDVTPDSKPRSEIFIFAGDAEQTLVRAKELQNGKLAFDGKNLFASGDGTVARYSAIADERFGGGYEPWLRSPIPFSNVTFLSDDHIGLTKNPHFTDNMLFLLLEQSPPPK